MAVDQTWAKQAWSLCLRPFSECAREICGLGEAAAVNADKEERDGEESYTSSHTALVLSPLVGLALPPSDAGTLMRTLESRGVCCPWG